MPSHSRTHPDFSFNVHTYLELSKVSGWLQDLNSMNKDPRYIPMLPNATPMSTKSLNKKSKNLPKISENDEPITPKQSKSSKKKSNNMSKSSSADKRTKNRDPPGAREPLDDQYYEL